MLRKTMLALGSSMMLFGIVAVAEPAEETAAPVENTVANEQADAAASSDHLHWHFITCTHTRHECSHEAQHHGYHHWRAAHDHHRCHGHAHYACWGAHH